MYCRSSSSVSPSVSVRFVWELFSCPMVLVTSWDVMCMMLEAILRCVHESLAACLCNDVLALHVAVIKYLFVLI